MVFDIVEIGTSDFRTEAGKTNGLFIEPVKEYFDRLPECIKENIAISNKKGKIKVYYIPSETITKKGLPNWVRGCNSIDNPHPTLINMGLSDHIINHEINVERIFDVLEKHKVTFIKFLKIDTEGHDTVILDDFLDTCDIRPLKIQFEANELNDKSNVESCVKRLTDMGYVCKTVKSDMVCVLS